MTAAGSALRLALAVPTYRRVDTLARLLPRLLDQLDRLAATGTTRSEVLVVDNDPGQSAAAAVRDCADPRLRYVAEARPGVAAVRNRALTEARDADVLVFLDDDQTPAEQWLVALAEVAGSSGAAGVAGPVVSVLPEDADPWVRDGGFFDRSYRAPLRTGDPLTEVATTNLWLDLGQVRALGLRFDERFGLSGGEDSLFTRTLVRRGGAIVWCADARVLESVPADRLTRGWVCRRAVSSGNTAARVELALTRGSAARTRRRAVLVVQGGARAGSGLVGVGIGVLSRSTLQQGRGTRRALRGWGMLLGAVDLSFLEYRRQGSRWVFDAVRRRGGSVAP